MRRAERRGGGRAGGGTELRRHAGGSERLSMASVPALRLYVSSLWKVIGNLTELNLDSKNITKYYILGLMREWTVYFVYTHSYILFVVQFILRSEY